MIIAAILTATALLVAACGGQTGGGTSGTADDGAEEETQEDTGDGMTEEEESEGTDTGAGKELEIGYIVWAEDIAATYLWEALLEERGYDVTLTQLEVAPTFAGLADGSLDFFLDAWLPATHSTYIDEYGDQIEDLGIWYDKADLGLAVPNYAEAQSIADLPDYADAFGQQIVGIDAGAGLMRITREEAIPGYGLDEWELIEGSETSMLASLDNAVANEEPVVVTLWRPHWAFAEYPIRYLEDPQGLMNPAGSEQLHALGRLGFSEDHPEVAKWIGNFEMTLAELASLEAKINQMDSEAEAAQAWLEENRDVVDPWFE